MGNLRGHARRKDYFCQKNTHLSDRLEEKASPLVLHSHCYETNTTGEMWQKWKLYTSLLEQLSTVKCADSQRNCQLSSRGKEWSLGLEGFPGGSAAMTLPAVQETGELRAGACGWQPTCPCAVSIRGTSSRVTPPPTPSSRFQLRRD